MPIPDLIARSLAAMALGLASAATAAPPIVEHLFPAGGQRGMSLAVTAAGKFDPWPVEVWTSVEGLRFKAGEKSGEFAVEIDKDVPPGPHLVRFYSADGASALRCFVVGDRPELSEAEPNDDARKAQTIGKLPVVINGQFEKTGDADSFAVKVDAGEWLVAALDARSLGSPVDALLQVLDSEGTELAFNHDANGLDPLLAFRAPSSGTYVIQAAAFAYPPAADVRFAGSKSAIYRLTLTTGAFARYAFPAGVQRGRRTMVHVFGWNLGSTGWGLAHEVDATDAPRHVEQVLLALPGVENQLRIPVGDLREHLEIEPNEALDLAQQIPLPAVVNGRIDPPRDEDRFTFAAGKGERIVFHVRSATLGFPLDAVLRVEDERGTVLASADDGGGAQDPRLEWAAPEDGRYVVAVSDLYRGGGADHVYRLEMSHPAPSFSATVGAGEVRLMAGKTAELTVNVARRSGHEGPLAVLATGLPEGVAATAAEVPAKGGAVKLVFSAGEDAKAANQVIRVVVVATDERRAEVRPAIIDLRPKDVATDMLINEADAVWLTVVPSPPPPAEDESKPEADQAGAAKQ